MNTHSRRISVILLSMAIIFSMLAVALPVTVVRAADLTLVTNTLGSYYAGATTTHTIAFTTATNVTANAKIAIDFPPGFNVSGATLGTISAIDGTMTLSVSGTVITGQTVIISRNGDGSTYTSPVTVSVPLSSVVNSSTPDHYVVTVSTQSGGIAIDGPTDSAEFEILPGATFTPISGPVGTTITVSGTGWTASEGITGVLVGGAAAAQTLTVNGSGVLSGTITVPSGTSSAIIRITGATSGAQNFADAFTVTTAMSTFTPITGPVGTTLTITVGSGWAPSDTISTVTVGGVSATKALVVSAGGLLSGTITVPTVAPGVKTVIITGATSGAQTSGTSFTVTPSATFIPVTGPIGTVITVSGTGWTASDNVTTVTIGGVSATKSLAVSSGGVLSGTITVPTMEPAALAHIVFTCTSGTYTFEDAFTVTATATFYPSSGPAGTTISTVSGTGWVASDHDLTVTVGGTAATSHSLTVSPAGVLSGGIETASSLTNGVKTIVITGTHSGAQTFTNAFTVTSTATINLRQGWNLISLPLVPDSTAISAIMPSNVQALMTSPYGQIVYLSYLSGAAAAPTWQWWTPDRGSTFSTMEDGKAYWIYVSQACSFTVTGTACGAAAPDAVANPRAYWMYYSSSYPDGWNLLGFKSSQTDMDASVYLQSLPSGSYAPIMYRYDGAWVSVGSTEHLVPGAGYYIRMHANSSVLPPCN